MVKGSVSPTVIDWIRTEINRIRAYVHSQPQHEELTDVDTLLSVAESEAARLKGGDKPTFSGDEEDPAPPEN
jgi:hypothetical protein